MIDVVKVKIFKNGENLKFSPLTGKILRTIHLHLALQDQSSEKKEVYA